MPKYFYAEIIKKLCSQTKNILSCFTLTQSQPLFYQNKTPYNPNLTFSLPNKNVKFVQ